jgi:hypothetical protein
MQSFENLQSKFPQIRNWEKTGRTRKGNHVLKGSTPTLVESFHPDAYSYSEDGEWETHYGLLVVIAIVDAEVNRVFAYKVKEW